MIDLSKPDAIENSVEHQSRPLDDDFRYDSQQAETTEQLRVRNDQSEASAAQLGPRDKSEEAQVRQSTDAAKYQNSFPTPKNTTPLGYHTRKKQVKKTSLEKIPRQDRSKTGSLLIQGDSEVDSATWAGKANASN